MRAAVYHRYGGPEVLGVRDLADPRPGPEDLLVRVRAAAVNPVDWKIRRGLLRLFVRPSFPMVPGSDLAGEVVEVGTEVDRFRPGDPVYAMLRPQEGGACAQLAAVPQDAAARKPESLSFEQAAAVPLAALTALQALRDHGKLAPGMSLLVNGGAGGVGHFAVQLGKILGAEVTAVASGENQELLRRLGADEALDYEREDFTALGRRWDVILDAVARYDFPRCSRALSRRGIYITTLPALRSGFHWLATRVAGLFGYGKRASFVVVSPRGDELGELARLADGGDPGGDLRPVIHGTWPLEAIAAAHEESQTHHARGKIVIRIP